MFSSDFEVKAVEAFVCPSCKKPVMADIVYSTKAEHGPLMDGGTSKFADNLHLIIRTEMKGVRIHHVCPGIPTNTLRGAILINGEGPAQFVDGATPHLIRREDVPLRNT